MNWNQNNSKQRHCLNLRLVQSEGQYYTKQQMSSHKDELKFSKTEHDNDQDNAKEIKPKKTLNIIKLTWRSSQISRECS